MIHEYIVIFSTKIVIEKIVLYRRVFDEALFIWKGILFSGLTIYYANLNVFNLPGKKSDFTPCSSFLQN